MSFSSRLKARTETNSPGCRGALAPGLQHRGGQGAAAAARRPVDPPEIRGIPVVAGPVEQAAVALGLLGRLAGRARRVSPSGWAWGRTCAGSGPAWSAGPRAGWPGSRRAPAAGARWPGPRASFSRECWIFHHSQKASRLAPAVAVGDALQDPLGRRRARRSRRAGRAGPDRGPGRTPSPPHRGQPSWPFTNGPPSGTGPAGPGAGRGSS